MIAYLQDVVIFGKGSIFNLSYLVAEIDMPSQFERLFCVTILPNGE